MVRNGNLLRTVLKLSKSPVQRRPGPWCETLVPGAGDSLLEGSFSDEVTREEVGRAKDIPLLGAGSCWLRQ